MPEQRLDPTVLAIVASTPAVLRTMLTSVSTAALEAEVDEGWSAKDVVAHLLDTDDVAFVERIRRIVGEDRPLLQPIDPSVRLKEQDYVSWTLDRLLDALDRKRSEDIDLLRNLSEEQMTRLGDHAEAGEISVSDLAHYCALHDLMHLRQIARMLQTQLVDKVGNMRRYAEDV